MTSNLASLQVPYLLNIAGQVNNYLPSFPSSPKATFGLLRKLDHAFSSLLAGEDSITGEILPGFEGGKRTGFSKTDMVRCKGLVEATRVIAVDLMSAEPEVATNAYESEADTDVEMESTWDMEEDMNVARVYEQTIVKLGELLESSVPFQAATPNTFQC